VNAWLWAWSTWVMTGLCLEVYGVWLRPGPNDTFSEWTGVVTHAATPAGSAVLEAIMLGLLAWYPTHVRALAKRNTLPEPRKEQ